MGSSEVPCDAEKRARARALADRNTTQGLVPLPVGGFLGLAAGRWVDNQRLNGPTACVLMTRIRTYYYYNYSGYYCY